MASTITVEVELDDSGAVKNLNKFKGKAQKSGEESGKRFSGAFSSFLGNLGAIAFTRALQSVQNQIAGVVGAAQNLEVIETQFATILKSTEAAQKQLQDLQNFAASTPFQIEGLSLATRQLLSFGVAQQNIIPTLRQIGDLAAGTGSRIDELTIPFGRLISTQKLTLVELDKFADRGINLYGKLSEQTGISLKFIRDEISKGRVPFEEFTKAIGDLTSEGGTFFQATQKQSKTLSGVLSTLGDNFFNLQAAVGRLFSPILIEGANVLIKAFQGLNKELQSINLKSFSDELFNVSKSIIEFVVAPLELLLNVFTVVQNGLNTFVAGFIAGIGQLAGALGDFLKFVSPDSELAESLKTFEQTSAEVFDNVAKDSRESLESILDFPFSEKLLLKNEELRESLNQTKEIISQASNEINANLEQSTEKATDSFLGFKIGFADVAKGIQERSKQAAAIVRNSLGRGIADSISFLVTNLQNGKSAFDNFGKFVLGVFGDLAVQLGQFFIIQGIAVEALKSLGGAAAVAAGAALVALGTLLKSASGAGSDLAPTAGGAGVGAGDNFAGGVTPDTGGDIAEAEPEEREQQVNQIVVQGDVFDTEETGRRIFDIVSNLSEKNGNVIVGGSFA